jgi:aspartyl-tRNA(Asn)/glutamyl-tRNA(Gln) amidotransferase subunit A
MPILTSIIDAAAHLIMDTLTSEELVELCLHRIRRRDPRIHAWEVVDEAGAIAAARRLDGQRTAGGERGMLDGIPVGIKDVIDVQGLPTRAGSSLRAGRTVAADAPVVAKLRAAGAVILGKTVTCQFASFDPSPTRNPWNQAHTPGGSSSGSAAAVASGMCLGAIGTQTGGSVIRPAAYCGIVGYKPTFEWVSREGVVPVSEHLDHVGFFGHCVSDVFALASAVCESLLRQSAGSLASLPGSRSPQRLGVLGGLFHEIADEETRRLLQLALEKFRSAGARVESCEAPAGIEDALRHHHTITIYDVAQYHREAFATQAAAYGPNLSSLIREGLTVSAQAYRRALEHQQHFTAAIRPVFEGYDALLMPATPTTAPARLDTTGDPIFNAAWSYAGTPAICIPCGLDAGGMPAAVQLVGQRDADYSLLAAAMWCEDVLAFNAAPAI